MGSGELLRTCRSGLTAAFYGLCKTGVWWQQLIGVPKKTSLRVKLWHVHHRLPRHGTVPRPVFDVLPQKVSKPVSIYSMKIVRG